MEDEVQNYAIVQIDDTNNEHIHQCLIVVPVSYIIIENTNQRFFVRYMAPPYDEEDLQLIKNIIQNKDLPPPEA